MNAWKVIASTLVIFIAGVVTGGLLVTYSIRFTEFRHKPANAAANSNNNPAAANNPWLLKNTQLLHRMDRELDLTRDQHEHIAVIIAASQERIKILWRPVAPLMGKEMQQVRSEIYKELTPEQRKKFEGFNKPRLGRRNSANSVPSNAPTNLVSTNSAQ